MTTLVRTTKTDRLMRTYYPACGSQILCEMLGLKPQQVRDYAWRLGIKTRNRGGKPFQCGHDHRRKIPVPMKRKTNDNQGATP